MRRLKCNVADGPETSDLDLTPMLDVVFILLIFFVVTASFLKEAGLQAKPSQAATQNRSESEVILVEVLSGDEIRLNGRIVDPRAVRPNLEGLHAADPDQPVLVQVADASSVQALVTVLDAIEQADMEALSVGRLER